MTEHTPEEKGVILALIKRLVDQRLPRLLDMQKRVERGELLSDYDISYLEEAMQEANQNRHHIVHFPEYKELASKLAQLYEQITEKALENQRSQK